MLFLVCTALGHEAISLSLKLEVRQKPLSVHATLYSDMFLENLRVGYCSCEMYRIGHITIVCLVLLSCAQNLLSYILVHC